MAKTAFGGSAVFSAVLLLAATSYAAGDLGATLVVISADPDQVNGGGAPGCSDITPCTYPRDDGSFAPAIRFIMGGPATVDVSADIWGTAFDCTGDPDDSVGRSMDLPGGPYIIYIIFEPPPVTGDTFAITWNLSGCPTVFCALYWTPPTIGEAEPPACGLSRTAL